MLQKNRRLIVSLITGALLGLVCVVGVGWRVGGLAGNEWFLFAMWYNRVIMGLVIGLAADLEFVHHPANRYIRGLILGALVSAAIFFSTEMRDIPALFAGIVYGPIIEFVARWFD
ncbi:MAG: hypothetical protein KKA73_23975 [Chloroflexi bacterium]|nr:hypothetical protein [Chloroflexota bacterium]MBU1750750.1 hypothetical protein [Chloroflexota bacterium]MBU1877420.1 hypothetical protein [Chloroflexota bacterium]